MIMSIEDLISIKSVPAFTPLTGLFIKGYLMDQGEAHASEVYSAYKKLRPSTSYGSIRRYFYILRKLGLIEFVRSEEGRGLFPKRIHQIVPGMEDAEEWIHPQIALYPQTKWGKKRYNQAKEEGLIEYGRNPKYSS